MAQKIGKEFKKTFSQLTSAFKNEEADANEKMMDSKAMTAVADRTDEEMIEKYRHTLNKADNDVSGRIVNSVTQKNKPRRSLYINESKSVRAMEMKEKDDAYIVIDEIRTGQPVLVMLDKLEQNVQKDILYTIYGACHYGNITIEKIAPQIILIDPKLEK